MTPSRIHARRAGKAAAAALALLLGSFALCSVSCGAGARGGSHGRSPELCRRMVDRMVACGRTPPSQASVELDRCTRQQGCWHRIVQPHLVPRLQGCMASAPCHVDCFDAVMAGAPMSQAAGELERVCLAKGCGSRCEIARDLAGASDEILRDVAWCFQHKSCHDVEGCAVGAVVTRAIQCAGMGR